MSGEPASAWCVLALITLAVLASMTTWFAATAILPQLTLHLSLSAAEQAWMTNGVQLGFVAGALAMSFVSLPDIAPIRQLLGISTVLAAVFNLGLLFAPNGALAIAMRIATGVALAGIYPPALKLVASWFRTGRGLAMGIVIGGLTLGSATPHLLRALTGALDWRFVVLATSAMTLLGGAIFLMVGREGPYAFSRAVFDPRQLGRAIRNRGVALANLGYFGHMWELYAMWGWLLAFLAASPSGLALEPAGLSALVFLAIAGGFFGSLVGGMLGDRIGRTHTTALAMGGSAGSVLLIVALFDAPLPLLALAAMLWGITVIADSAQFSAMTTELSDPDLVGTALAFQLAVGFALTIVSIWLVPILASAVGWRWTFLILVPGPVIGVAAMLLLRQLPEAARIAQGRR